MQTEDDSNPIQEARDAIHELIGAENITSEERIFSAWQSGWSCVGPVNVYLAQDGNGYWTCEIGGRDSRDSLCYCRSALDTLASALGTTLREELSEVVHRREWLKDAEDEVRLLRALPGLRNIDPEDL